MVKGKSQGTAFNWRRKAFNQMWFQPTFYLFTFTFCLILVGLVGAAVTILALSRHQKRASGQLYLAGALAKVETTLKPEGSVIVLGELWRATSRTGATIERKRSVRVVGTSGHLLLVEPTRVALP
jgi:membrane-bound ClpP family serine protease